MGLFAFNSMAKGQKELQKQATDRSNEQYAVGKTAQQNLITGTPEMQADTARINARRATINSGDYANAKDFVSNKDRLTEQNKVRQNALSLAPTGAGAIAMKYANPNQIALGQKISDNEFAQAQSAQAEDDVRQYMSQTDAESQNLINRQIGFNQGIMGEGFQQGNYNLQQASQIAAQRSQAMYSMIGAALGGFASFATAGMGSGLTSLAKSPSSIMAGADQATQAGLSTSGSLMKNFVAMR